LQAEETAYLSRVTCGIAHGIDEPSEHHETAECGGQGWVAEPTKEDGEQGMRHALECVLMGTLSAVEPHRRWVGLGFRSLSIDYVGNHQSSAGTNGDGGPERKEKKSRQLRCVWRSRVSAPRPGEPKRYKRGAGAGVIS